MSAKALQYLAEFEPRKALPILRKAAARPTYRALVNYAVAQRGCGLIPEAKETLMRALAVDQTRPEAWANLAQVHEDLGDFQNTPGLFKRALEIIEKSSTPIHSAGEPLLGFAYSLMRLGQFPYVWPIWEAARLSKSWHPFPALHPWRGEPGARLLIVPEGGFGDGFNFLRWVRLLDVYQATVIVWDSMFEYTEHTIGKYAHVLPMSHKFEYDELAHYTHCTPYLSLMVHSLKKWSDIPAPLAWEPRGRIVAPPNDWIGFCWRAEENGVMRKTRSLDRHAADRIGKYLLGCCDRVVGLCPKGKALYRVGDETVPKGVTQDDALVNGWEDTALAMLKCKLIVTVDTAVAHLAGSLGIPTLIILPMRSDWKWGIGADSTAFYGRNVKLFRNTHPVDWDVDKLKKSIDLM